MFNRAVVLKGSVSENWKMGSQDRPSMSFEISFNITVVAGRKVTADIDL